ncbi:N utilization substance protein B [Legionella beliardensis]|uniref:Transcription antitermination protein NusB n=1 Tax=Legionella beliardensis TaxID=91822 RepID=A0A378I2Y6_9GAMM|nr:transcription antitermination factor NusB [Legionella beliardensis]STX29539.1 N utilization substance protein B [Legionella beliardensis]
MEKHAIRGKRRARRLVLQALYQWLMSKHELSEIETQFRVANNMDKVDIDYFCRLLYGVPKSLQAIEESFTPFLDISIESLNPIELTILRLSSYELLYCLDIPYRVVLDEAVTLAKEFGSQDGHRFVNGVLNKLAKQVRTVEINHQL